MPTIHQTKKDTRSERSAGRHEWRAYHSTCIGRRQCTSPTRQLTEAIARKNYDLAFIYAGEGVGLISQKQPAGEIIHSLGEDTERLLGERSCALPGQNHTNQ